MTQELTARTQQFGDYGAPRACWDAGSPGHPTVEQHARLCRDCRELLPTRRAPEPRSAR